MSPPYKDVMGRWRTRSLFREAYLDNDYEPVFTLQEEDYVDDKGRVLPSMRKLFVAYSDPTGYQFAKEVLGSYEHWKRLCKSDWFKQYLDIWQEELEVKLLSLSVRKMNEIANGESPQAIGAAKFIAERGWTNKKGRPKKADVEREAKIAAGVDAAVEDDLARIRLAVDNG